MRHAQFSADDVMTILRKHEGPGGCQLCGKKHVGSYGGLYYCRDKGHFAHGFGWSEPPQEPMTEAELSDLHAQIVREKNAKYPGGYAQWCDDREIPQERR